MDKKYQIFISSTYKDLIEQREQVVKTVLRMGHLPVGMEMFNAADQAQWEVIKRHIDNSDYYLVILAHRYGSLDDDGVGFTEKEYDYAVSRGIPCIGFVIDNSVSWPPTLIDSGELAVKLVKFKEEKVQKRMVNFWTTKEILAQQVLFALTDAINLTPGVGWVRSDKITANPLVAEEMSRLSKENHELNIQLAALSNQRDELADAKEVLSDKSYEFTTVDGSVYEGNMWDLFIHLGRNLLRTNNDDILNQIYIYKKQTGIESHYAPTFSRKILRPFLEEMLLHDLLAQEGAITSLTQKGKSLLLRYS